MLEKTRKCCYIKMPGTNGDFFNFRCPFLILSILSKFFNLFTHLLGNTTWTVLNVPLEEWIFKKGRGVC